jgi:hypothetical protein
MQAGNKAPRGGSMTRKMSADATAGISMRGIDEMLGARHSRKSSRDDQIPPPPPPPPPVLKELQHLAIPPPPPPAPLPGSARQGLYSPGAGSIEIVKDEDEQPSKTVPTATPMNESAVPIIAPPAPPSTRNGHNRGRSITDNSISSRISRATERMRSASRGRSSSILGSRTKSPDTGKGTSPYESLPPVSFNAAAVAAAQQQQQQQHQQMIERHPREVRATYHQQRESGTGLLQSEMI